MTSAGIGAGLHFDIHPSVVYQLGDGLITDAVQALVELIKNSYDADASYASVVISTGENEHPLSRYGGAKGFIVIEDNGHGMTLDVIRRGWLTISNSPKREMKRLKKVTTKGRVPLGDKGLGRLGAQRLGANVEIITKTPEQNRASYVAYSWDDFAGREVLTDVPITYDDDVQFDRICGTTLIISELNELETWLGDSTLELQKSLSHMICPYEELPGFRLVVTCDGRKLELAEITRRVREVAPLHYDIIFDSETLTITGRIRASFLRLNDKDDRVALNDLLGIDNGQSFLDFLVEKEESRDSYHIRRSHTPGWFVDFSESITINDLPSVERIAGEIADPGPFRGEVDSFDLSQDASTQQDIFSRGAEFRNYVKNLSGIRVYRDGFAIRVDRDWLRLGGTWTSGGSYYGLKPNNTLGYIVLSAGENGVIEETTDREGFKHTPYYGNFYGLLEEFVRFSSNAHEFIRRNAVKYLQNCRRQDAGVDEVTTPEDLARQLADGIASVQTIGIRLQQVECSLGKAMDATAGALFDIRQEKNSSTGVNATGKLEELATVLEAGMHTAKSVIVDLRMAVERTSPLVARGGVLVDQITALRSQLEEVYETIGLGLTAEALSHEIHLVADELARRTNKTQDHLRRNQVSDPVLVSFLEHIRSTASTLRKQLSYLDPSLRYVRERKDTIKISEFLSDFASFKEARATQKNIDIEVVAPSADDFDVSMNMGKLRQILDNLYMNSEYWLCQDMDSGAIPSGCIRIEISDPFLRFSDNGRGIDARVEGSLFEPFTTTKPRRVGRGLGLFIVRQLLDAEGCAIVLLPHRNQYGRRYMFQIDFTGGITG